jgi:CHRD domain
MKRLCTTFSILAALLAVSSSAYGDGGLRFEATLSGAQEVPTVTTDTTGQIQVEFDAGLTQAEFELSVFNGVGVMVAHFHCGRAGENGPVVVFLFGPVSGGIDVDGKLAAGTVTNADFMGVDCVPVIGRPVNNIASLFFAARDGLIYANVHTVAHSGGEARGQLLEKK